MFEYYYYYYELDFVITWKNAFFLLFFFFIFMLFKSHVASSHSNQVLNSTVDSLPTANKSTLFGTNATTNGTNSQTVNSSKPVPNYGKPNCAPKPPGIQQLVKPPGVNGKPTVSRHHSMKTPR